MTPALETIAPERTIRRQTHRFHSPVFSDNYSPAEEQLAAQYEMTVPQMRNTVAAAKNYPDVECDENGMPVGCTVPEWFDTLDKKLIDHFGEEYRVLANESRMEWNRKGPWTFDLL
jgi:hypothetical protein